MKRRTFIAALATTTVGGCTSQADPSTETEHQEWDIANAEYEGLHEKHRGVEIEEVDYYVDTNCRGTVEVIFGEEPQSDAVIHVWFYKSGEQVHSLQQEVREVNMGMRETVGFKYCTFDKYDSFSVAVL